MADGGDEPVDIGCFVVMIGEGKPVPCHQRWAVAFADQLFRLLRFIIAGVSPCAVACKRSCAERIIPVSRPPF
jgi:hypothetical protein